VRKIATRRLRTRDDLATDFAHPTNNHQALPARARAALDHVSEVVRIAVPVEASSLSVFPEDAPPQRGNIQIDLF
jgi:hypothetical protein